jgi:hypothetical protein
LYKCGKTSTTDQSRKRHYATHFLAKHFGCTKCGKTSTSDQNRKRHYATHFLAKHFGCTKCGKTSTSDQNRKTHYATHFLAKHFGCTKCGKTFNSRTAQIYHNRRKFCDSPHCSFTGQGPCSADLERFVLIGHPLIEPTCPAHLHRLYDHQHSVTHGRWPAQIPTSVNCRFAYSGPINEQPPPAPILENPNVLKGPLMRLKNPNDDDGVPPPPLTEQIVLDAVNVFSQKMVQVNQIPVNFSAPKVGGFIFGQTVGDGTWNGRRSGPLRVAFYELDDAGINFYISLTVSLGGQVGNYTEHHSQGCRSITLTGVAADVIMDLLTKLQYLACYKYISMSLIDVLLETNNQILLDFCMGFFAGYISSDGSGGNNFLSLAQSGYWHGDGIVMIYAVARKLGITVRRGYAHRGEPLLCGYYRAGMVLVFSPCQALRNLSLLITAGRKRDVASREDIQENDDDDDDDVGGDDDDVGGDDGDVGGDDDDVGGDDVGGHDDDDDEEEEEEEEEEEDNDEEEEEEGYDDDEEKISDDSPSNIASPLLATHSSVLASTPSIPSALVIDTTVLVRRIIHHRSRSAVETSPRTSDTFSRFEARRQIRDSGQTEKGLLVRSFPSPSGTARDSNEAERPRSEAWDGTVHGGNYPLDSVFRQKFASLVISTTDTHRLSVATGTLPGLLPLPPTIPSGYGGAPVSARTLDEVSSKFRISRSRSHDSSLPGYGILKRDEPSPRSGPRDGDEIETQRVRLNEWSGTAPPKNGGVE